MVVHKLEHNKPLTINKTEGIVYIKYPYEKQYFMSLKSKYKKNKKEYVNSVVTLIPKNGENAIRYRDGYCSEIVNLENG